MRPRVPKRKCILCGTALSASDCEGLLLHPDVGDKCGVVITDHLGISVDDEYEYADGKVWTRAAAVIDPNQPIEFGGAFFTVDGTPVGSLNGGIGDGPAFVSAEAGAKKLFEAAGLPYLGGSSGTRGWSSISAFQRCPYLWRAQHSGGKTLLGDAPGPEALEIGTLVHILLAVHYSQLIDPLYPLDPEAVRRFLQLVPVTPGFLEQAWQLFEGYRLWWGDESSWLTPLAVEEQVTDPRTGFSCRWDLVFRVNTPYETLLPGVYVTNHKTAGNAGAVTRDQWQNDGQILGEIDLYERLNYHKRWGQLRGACINLIIKTLSPQYLRSYVYPAKGILRDHRKSLAIWSAQMEMAKAADVYPRARAACITKFHGFCELFKHCAGADEPREIEP